MGKSGARPELRMLAEQLAGGFDGVEIAFGDFPVGVDRIPLKLAFHVRDEIAGLVDAHATEILARTRSRMAVKSALVSGVTGLSAASISHASNSGVMAKNLRCCSRSERMTSLTSSLASAQTPELT